jgi:ABC-2 type transport system ATP-binding protein
MNEMAVTADHLIVIGRGRLLADAATEEVIARSSGQTVLVRTPDPDRLTALITAEGGKAVQSATGNGNGNGSTPAEALAGQPADRAPLLTVTGIGAARIGELAAQAGVVLHELTPQMASLEEAFLELTADSLEYGHLDAQPADWSSR